MEGTTMLQSQRFSGNATLEACVTHGYRMLQGEPDTTAVLRLQSALIDLGYQVDGGLDGQFGDGTGKAVVAFKTDENLQPNDPVASTGTIGRLDQYFSHEAVDPDVPDPSALGLSDVTQAAMATAVHWLNTAIDAIDGQFPAWDERPNDPNWIALNNLLERNFHISRSTHDRRVAS